MFPSQRAVDSSISNPISSNVRISIIIPTFNEAKVIQRTIRHLTQNAQGNVEILISDSPNSVDSLELLQFNAKVKIIKSKFAGRAPQMNEAAAAATGEILYFVHADTLIHPDFERDIQQALAENYDLGCYRYRFDKYFTPLLHINAYFTRFDKIWCRGGDQTLFIKRSVFNEIGGFRSDLKIMEDYEILQRVAGKFRFKIIPKEVVVSSRKYQLNGYFKVQLANLKVMRMFLQGTASSDEMARTYKQMLRMDYTKK